MSEREIEGVDEKAEWNKDLVRVFCQLCVDRIQAGDKHSTCLSKEGYKKLMAAFKEKTGKDYTQKQFKYKWDALKKEWSIWEKIEKFETGVGWDDARDTIQASDDWWDKKIKEDKRVKKYRHHGIENRELLRQMFSGHRATGRDAYVPGTQVYEETPHEGDLQEAVGEQRHVHLFHEDDSEDEEYIPNTEHGDSSPNVPCSAPREGSSARKRTSSSQRHRQSQRKRAFEVQQDISSSLDKLATYVIGESTSSHPAEDPFSTAACCKVLKEMPEISANDELLDFALWLFTNAKERTHFMNIPSSDWRLRWLRIMYREKYGRAPPS